MTILKLQAITTAILIGMAGVTTGLAAKSGGGSAAHVNKGVELAQQKQYDAAVAEFNAAIQADPIYQVRPH